MKSLRARGILAAVVASVVLVLGTQAGVALAKDVTARPNSTVEVSQGYGNVGCGANTIVSCGNGNTVVYAPNNTGVVNVIVVNINVTLNNSVAGSINITGIRSILTSTGQGATNVQN